MGSSKAVPQLIEHQVNVTADVRDGLYSGTNDIVRRLTGAEPLTIDAFIERNPQHFEQRAAWSKAGLRTGNVKGASASRVRVCGARRALRSSD
jgi:hypothetical protein